MRWWTLSLSIIVAISALLTVSPKRAMAQIELSKIVIDFEPEHSGRDDVEITNPTDETLYIKATPYRVIHPGQPDERRETVNDPRAFGMLVTPNKLVLPPGTTKILRLVALSRQGDSDRIYRVTVQPIYGEIVSDQTAIKISVGYDMLVIIRPPVMKPNVTGRRSGKTLTMRNDGNTNVLLLNGKQCPDNADDCVDLPSKRLYPNMTWSIDLRHDAPVSYTLLTGSESTSVVFK